METSYLLHIQLVSLSLLTNVSFGIIKITWYQCHVANNYHVNFVSTSIVIHYIFLICTTQTLYLAIPFNKHHPYTHG